MSKLDKINKYLRLHEINDELVRGEGYFYFIGDKADKFYSSSVFVNNINDLTNEQWLDAYRELEKVYKKKMGG